MGNWTTSTWTTRNVLVLNASYEAIHICDVRRALKMLVKGVASVEEHSDVLLRAEHWAVHMPHVIRLRQYIQIPHRPVKFSRRNVLVRDRYTCQYCHNVFSAGELTLDHVFPRSRGGKTTWDNVLSACKRCNLIKSNRTPAEASMTALRAPNAPTITYFMQLTRFSNVAHESWRKYLFLK